VPSPQRARPQLRCIVLRPPQSSEHRRFHLSRRLFDRRPNSRPLRTAR
jgi:hypothetical protein